jgi:ribosomal protein S27AE
MNEKGKIEEMQFATARLFEAQAKVLAAVRHLEQAQHYVGRPDAELDAMVDRVIELMAKVHDETFHLTRADWLEAMKLARASRYVCPRCGSEAVTNFAEPARRATCKDCGYSNDRITFNKEV